MSAIQRQPSPAPSGVVVDVDLRQIDFHDSTYCLRRALRIEPLAESIRAHGQQIPAILRRRPDRERLQIVCGFRRIAALQRLERPTVRAIVRDDLTDHAALAQCLLENVHRKAYSPLELSMAICRLKEEGETMARIAQMLGLGKRQTQHLELLTRFPGPVRDALDAGTLRATHAITMMKALGPDATDDGVAPWIERVRVERPSVLALARALGAEVRQSRARQPVRLFKVDGEAGTTLSIALLPRRLVPSEMTPEEVAEVRGLLSELLDHFQ